jgi:carbonic anhydrase
VLTLSLAVWIGCADSRVPETTILGLQPGDAFVHRNIANVVVPTDVNTLAVVEFAVAYVKVKHIILCGHTSCAGCAATVAGTPLGLLLDSWLTQLRILRQAHEEELASIEDVDDRAVRLAELNVERGISNLMSNSVVQAAVRERGLQIHGTIYNTGTGRLRDLGLGTAKKGSASLCPGMASKGPELLKGNHGVLVFAEGDVISLAVK